MSNNIDKLILKSESSSLTQEEEREILNKIKNKEHGWQEGQGRLIQSYLLYLVKCANFYSKCPHQIDDLVSEGIVGIIYAIDKFDLTKTNRFLTFASHHIRGRMCRFLMGNNFNNIFHVPPDVVRLCNSIKSFMENWKAEKKSYAPTEILLEKFNLDEAHLNFILILIKSSNSTFEHSDLESNCGAAPLNFFDSNSPDIESQKKESQDIIRLIVEKLPAKQRFVINKRFGLNNGERLDLLSIGFELKVTKQRVAQIEADAIKTIRKEIKKFDISIECLL